MGNVILLNGSPRAPKSNSKKYSEIFIHNYKGNAKYYEISKKNHQQLCAEIETASDIVFVFPLYVDTIPVTLLNFLKTLKEYPANQKPTVHILINCGFLEPEQNHIALEVMKLFCKQHGYPFGSTLSIGGGEAILKTPLAFFAKQKIKKLAKAIFRNQSCHLQVTMPLSKPRYLKESTKYWIRYGEKHGITKEEMDTMEIEA